MEGLRVEQRSEAKGKAPSYYNGCIHCQPRWHTRRTLCSSNCRQYRTELNWEKQVGVSNATTSTNPYNVLMLTFHVFHVKACKHFTLVVTATTATLKVPSFIRRPCIGTSFHASQLTWQMWRHNDVHSKTWRCNDSHSHNTTKKPCHRKETARYSSCSLRF